MKAVVISSKSIIRHGFEIGSEVDILSVDADMDYLCEDESGLRQYVSEIDLQFLPAENHVPEQ